MQRLQIIQLGQYALQAAAKKIIIENLTMRIGLIYRNFIPILMQLDEQHDIRMRRDFRYGRIGPEKYYR